ncbi:hypothetical protein IMCC1989_1288 [gamma proteobacterium IMCC1989]|nr:hypothetical protein IMCC1989_1288 [gamma proteobacterium IMCC1989]
MQKLIPEDYQWPNFFFTPEKYDDKLEQNLTFSYEEIEKYFKGAIRGDHELCLLSSGRSALSAIIRFLKLNRNHATYAPPYSSLCVWNSICHYANPQTSIDQNTDAACIVHKWGYVEDIGKNNVPYIIEDSVDSIPLNANTLFPNNGIAEVISLPKTIGSYSGALVISKDLGLINFIKELREARYETIKSQSRLRNQESRKDVTNNELLWSHNEWNNFGLDQNALKNISEYAKNWKENQSIILSRRTYLNEIFQRETSNKDKDRCQAVYLLPEQEYSSTSNQLMTRFFNTSMCATTPNYQKHLILPLHMGVDEQTFQNLINSVIKNA